MRPRNVVSGLVVLVAAIITVGLVAGSDGGDDGQPIQTGRLTQLEHSGELSVMLEQHRQMLEAMQDDVSPAMLERMNNDPMWQMLRTDEWARLDEEHQADLDRMLGQGSP